MLDGEGFSKPLTRNCNDKMMTQCSKRAGLIYVTALFNRWGFSTRAEGRLWKLTSGIRTTAVSWRSRLAESGDTATSYNKKFNAIKDQALDNGGRIVVKMP